MHFLSQFFHIFQNFGAETHFRAFLGLVLVDFPYFEASGNMSKNGTFTRE